LVLKTLLILFLFEAWEQMLKFTSFKRQEINLVFKIKVFVVSKIWYFNKSIYFYFPKIWVVTLIASPAPFLDPGTETCRHDTLPAASGRR
jgi:hypothetical protein